MQQRKNEKNAILCGTEHFGGCSRMYQNILESWGYFFKKRAFQARAVLPVHKFNIGQRSVASFGRYALTE